MAIEIRLLQDNEAELANNFFNEIYKTHRSIKNFRWEFFEGPSGKAIYVVAIDHIPDQPLKIVGIQCAIPIEFISPSGVTVLTAKSEDTLVHPEYRGQKLFERMYDLLFKECRNAGIKYIWGFTPAVKAFQRLGFDIPFQTSQALMVFSPLKAYNYLVKLNPLNSWKEQSKIFALSMLAWSKKLVQQLSGMELLTEVAIDSVDIKFFKEKEFFFLHENTQYLEWRIHRNPFGNSYRRFQKINDGKITADVVVNRRGDVGYIEQMYFDEKLDFNGRVKIIKAAAGHLKNSGAGLVRALCFANNSIMVEQRSILEAAGFVHLQRGNHFVWKSLDDKNSIHVNNVVFSRLFTQGNN